MKPAIEVINFLTEQMKLIHSEAMAHVNIESDKEAAAKDKKVANQLKRDAESLRDKAAAEAEAVIETASKKAGDIVSKAIDKAEANIKALDKRYSIVEAREKALTEKEVALGAREERVKSLESLQNQAVAKTAQAEKLIEEYEGKKSRLEAALG